MTIAEVKVFLFLLNNSRPDGELCFPFTPIEEATGLQRNIVRRACRSLARQKLAEFHRGLWNDDGAPGGAGYCISSTALGLEKASQNAA